MSVLGCWRLDGIGTTFEVRLAFGAGGSSDDAAVEALLFMVSSGAPGAQRVAREIVDRLGLPQTVPSAWVGEIRTAIATGTLVVVDKPIAKVAAVSGPPLQQTDEVVVLTPPETKPSDDDEVEAGPTYFEVDVVDECGEPIASIPLVYDVEGPQTELTDGSGHTRLDDVNKRFGSVGIDDLDALRDAVRERWDAIRQLDWIEPTADTTFAPLRGMQRPEALILSETLHTLVIQPWVIRARLIGMYFDTNKSFLLPTSMVSIRKVKELYEAYPLSAVLVVGHTDTTADPSYNDPLSLERAKATAAFLKDDVDSWLAWYGPAVSYEKKWGGREDGLMLSALADGPILMASPSPIAAFQSSRGLGIDGWAGDETRRQLIKEYMSQDETTLPNEATITAHGCGENFPLVGDELSAIKKELDIDDDQLQRRVEIYFFDRALGTQPPPAGDNSAAGSLEYPEWVRRARETHDFSLKSVMRIRVFDHFAEPMAGVDYMVDFGDQVLEGKTDSSGCVVLKGKLPSASTCVVRWNRSSVSNEQSEPALCFEFEKTVHLDADHRVDDEALRTRLTNLGYEPAAKLEDCIRHFQFQHGLPTTGDPNDPAMIALLVERHHAMSPRKREHELHEVGAENHA